MGIIRSQMSWFNSLFCLIHSVLNFFLKEPPARDLFQWQCQWRIFLPAWSSSMTSITHGHSGHLVFGCVWANSIEDRYCAAMLFQWIELMHSVILFQGSFPIILHHIPLSYHILEAYLSTSCLHCVSLRSISGLFTNTSVCHPFLLYLTVFFYLPPSPLALVFNCAVKFTDCLRKFKFVEFQKHHQSYNITHILLNILWISLATCEYVFYVLIRCTRSRAPRQRSSRSTQQ